MLNIEDYKDSVLFRSVIELNEQLVKADTEKIELNVVGGFALMIREVRDKSGLTDIDYLGGPLFDNISEISKKIGLKNGLGHDWINNDIMLSGSSIEDFELSTGKLSFDEAFDLEKIKVNVLQTEDILKLKVIAIDTALSAVDYGGDFTRMKDFGDIIKICDKTGISVEELGERFKENIVNKKTIAAIRTYKELGPSAVNEMVERLQYEFHKQKFESQNYVRSSFIDDILDKAIAGAKEAAKREDIDR